MQTIKRQAARALARLALRKPERLWQHYCFALFLILCLVIATHLLNRTIIESGLAAAEGIKKSNEQVLIAQDIVMRARALDSQNAPDFSKFEKSVQQMEAIHRTLITSEIRSIALQNHYFEGNASLHANIRNFLILAKRLPKMAPELRLATRLRLEEIYHDRGLHDGLLKAATLFAQQMETDAASFRTMQLSILAASGIVLLAEAVFIFWPAQRAVQSTIRKMQEQTSVLRTSQTQLRRMNAQLEKIVKHDQLTGLPNRASLTSYLTDILDAKRPNDWSLLLVGLDDFKSVNDMIGHDYGDALLIAVSHALQSCVDYGSFVARVGGDEFVLISTEPTAFLVRRVMDALDEPFAIKGRRIPINASIGHLHIGNEVSQPLNIVADAEIALQFAKNAGGNRAQAFTEHLRDDLRLMQKLQLELRDAILNGEIEPWFQPKVRLVDGRLHGAEVLARWRHPTRGLLTPDLFLPAAERAGLMVDLDHSIWKSAMNYAWQWQDRNIWRPSISLNAAPDTIADPYLLERFLLTLQKSGLEANQVIVEVLETTLINGKDDMAAINIDSLAECGIALELDDFGTGYASLSKLTQLPIAGIKLDRSLIAPLPDQAADSVVRAILALATELGLHVVAEGVEQIEQATHLSERGCGFGQGYGFGKPMPPKEFGAWLAANAQNTLQASPKIA